METQWETAHLRVRGRWSHSTEGQRVQKTKQAASSRWPVGSWNVGSASPFPGAHWTPGVPATSMAKPRGLGGLYHLIFTSKSHKKISCCAFLCQNQDFYPVLSFLKP